MAVDEADVVVIGAGHAGVEVAAALRMGGFPGSVTVLERGVAVPYERPPLSKGYLAGDKPLETISLRKPEYFTERSIDVRFGQSVVGIDRSAKEVQIEAGGGVRYGTLVIAAGGAPRMLGVPGASRGNILNLATVEDSDALRRSMVAGSKLVIVGGGFIGLEVAATARQNGVDVTVVEVLDRLMSRVLSAEMAESMRARHEAEGVVFEFGAAVSGFRGDDLVSGVELSDGRVLPADTVLVGIGAEASAKLATECGLDVGRGVVVDEHCRTSDPDVFAIGDVTETWNRYSHATMRLECVQNAVSQARTVAGALCGHPDRAPEVPWFWTDQYDLHLKIAGTSLGHDEHFVRGDPTSSGYSVGFLRDGALISLEALNKPKDFMQAKKLVAERAVIDVERASDATIPLAQATVPGEDVH